MQLCVVSSPPSPKPESPTDFLPADLGSPIPEPVVFPEIAGSPPPGEPKLPGPRERALESGFAVIGDADLLAIVLGTGCAGRHVTVVSAALLEQFGGLEGLARV